MAKTLEELLAQGKTTPYDELLKRQTSSPSQLIDDAGFTRNVLMKGIPGMEDSSPSFSGLGGVSWPPPGIPVTQDDLPPSPISPDIQSLFPPAKSQQEQSFGIQDTPVVKPSEAPKKSSVAAAAPSPEIAAAEISEAAPKEPTTLEKLLASYSQGEQPDNELAQLQKDRSNRQMMLDLIGAGTQLTSGLASAKYDPNLLNKFYERADQDITDLMARRKSEKEKKQGQRDEIKFAQDIEKYQMDKEKYQQQLQDDKAVRDPASEVSQTTKHAIADMLSKIGRKDQADKILNSKLSHKQLEDVYGQMNIQNYISMYEAQQNRLQTAKLAADAKKEQKTEKEKIDKANKLDKYIQQTREKITKESEAVQKGHQELTMLESAIKNPSAVKDTASLYSMVKSFDPESVVREGEVALAMKGLGYWDQANILFSRLKKNDTRLLNQNYLKQIYDYANEVQKVRDAVYRKNMDSRLNFARDRLGLSSGEEEYIDPLYKDTTRNTSESMDLTNYASGAAAELARRRNKGK